MPLASVCRLSVRHIAHVSHVLFYCYFLVSLARIDTCLTWLTCLREAHLTCPMWSFRRMAPFGPCVPLSSLAHLAHLTACNRHVSHLARAWLTWRTSTARHHIIAPRHVLPDVAYNMSFSHTKPTGGSSRLQRIASTRLYSALRDDNLHNISPAVPQ